MPGLDDIIDQIRDEAGADFAFVLTPRGRLVTQHAPKDMPELGRMELAQAGVELAKLDSQVTQVTMPRERLVPYGGAAPVDVYVAKEGDLLVCVVMASWASTTKVTAAIQAGFGRMQQSRHPTTAAVRRSTSAPPKPPSADDAATVTESPKASRTPAMAGLVRLSGNEVRPSVSLEHSPNISAFAQTQPPLGSRQGSLPDIIIGEAPLGRESLEAIEADNAAIAHSAAVAGRALRSPSMPDIDLGVAMLGRESLAAVEQEKNAGVPFGSAKGSIPDIRVSLATRPSIVDEELAMAQAQRIPGGEPSTDPLDRLTKPFTESAVDTKRALDAATFGRRVASPKVAVRLESMDEVVLQAIAEDVEEDLSLDDVELIDTEPPPANAYDHLPGDNDRRQAPPESGQRGSTGSEEPVSAAKVPTSKRPPRDAMSSRPSLDLWRDAIKRMIDHEGRGNTKPPPAPDAGQTTGALKGAIKPPALPKRARAKTNRRKPAKTAKGSKR